MIRWFIARRLLLDVFAGWSGLDAPRVRLIGVFFALSGCGRFNFDDRSGDGAVGVPTDTTSGLGWDHLVAYGDQTCATFFGSAYCWGDDTSNQLGVAANTTYARVPTPVLLPAGTVTALTEGQTDGCAIVDGTAYCYGALGGAAPTAVSITDARAVGAGNGFLCVVGGTAVSCWGTNANVGQLATGNTTPHPTPTPTLLTKTTAMSIGDDHGCVIDDGNPKCWGHNDDGTLGQGGMAPAFSATPLLVSGNVKTLPLIAGWHACALDAGIVRCWGEGDHGELGGTTDSGMPEVMPTLDAVTSLAVGGGTEDFDASCAIEAGRVKCWGAGNHGRLGQGTDGNSATPLVVPLPAGAVQAAIGYDHACALLVTDEIWCWGAGSKGQLGNNQMTDSYPPVRVISPTS